jgi:hypothetical protein
MSLTIKEASEYSETPCPRCLPLAGFGRIRAETVQPLPAEVPPLDPDGRECCWDCQAADNLLKLDGTLPKPRDKYDSTPFIMARIAVGNDRQEQYRLPGAQMGLVLYGIVRPSKPGDLERHHAWMERHDWFGLVDCDGGYP